jgi:phosphate transport system protein
MKSHLEASLQQDLDEIRRKVTEMGDLAAGAVEGSVRAVVERNRQLAFAVILRDQYIDEIEKQLDRMCLEFLVRHQPAAAHLRFAYAAIKINLELERVGDYAESIAREAVRLAKVDATLPIERLNQIAKRAVPMLRDAISAFVAQNAELARRTIESDDAVDLLRDELTQEITTTYKDGGLPFEAFSPLVQVIRRLERVSDQARNISMETLYMLTGEYAKHPGSEAMRVLFVDDDNASRSVMAEAIGSSLGERGFVFSSAGLEPRAVDEKAVNFLAKKGIDISRAVPKSLVQVPNYEHQHVIVLLSPELKRQFPRRPRRAVLLEWNVEDPKGFSGSKEEVEKAWEGMYQYIEGQIRDLVAAIRDSSTV